MTPTPTPTHTAALRAVIKHWNEFGPEHGFGEVIDQAERALAQREQPCKDRCQYAHDIGMQECSCRNGCMYEKHAQGASQAPRAWEGPAGQLIPHEFYVPMATVYPDKAVGYVPLYRATSKEQP